MKKVINCSHASPYFLTAMAGYNYTSAFCRIRSY